MNRRSFMQAILSAGVAPYVSTMAGVLMPVKSLWGTGVATILAPYNAELTRQYSAMLQGFPPGAVIFNNRIWWPERRTVHWVDILRNSKHHRQPE